VSRPDNVAIAHERLREAILSGELAPGSELSQVELARRVGLSTTPLREALRRLEAEGLVDARRNRRPLVRAFELSDLDSVYGSRILLESLAVALTVPAIDPGPLWDELAAMRSAGSPVAWEPAHERFHLLLVAGAPEALREQITTLMARGDRYRRIAVRGDDPPARAVGDAEHEAIARAARDGAGVRCAALLAAQLARSAGTVRDRLAAGGGLPAVDAALALAAPATV
jgi:DNA-binding GntR family transcriptional regulator